MKRETISVPFNTEKLEALYEKHVPTDVRERIEAQAAAVCKKRAPPFFFFLMFALRALENSAMEESE